MRISDDRAGEAADVGRQEKDARALAERLGWGVGEVFVENDTSAYKRRKVLLPDGSTALRVERPEFRRLLAAISDGAADGLIAYHLDRVARDPRDLEDLIDVVERSGVPVESVTGSLRLASDADVTMARIGVAIANQSSRDAARRIRRKHDELAAEGRYAGGGARRYGFDVDGVTLRLDEVEVIRECADRVVAGESVTSLCRDLDRRQIRPVKAATWSSKALGDILRSPRVAGLRVHRGEVVGKAAWPAILDEETWNAVVAVMHSRSAGRGKPALIRWLNQVLFCGRCGHGLTGAHTNNHSYRYWCNHRTGGCGGIAINGPGAEGEVRRQVLEYLSRPDVALQLAAESSQTGARQVRRELAADEEQLRQLSRMWAEKQISLDEFAEARKVIAARIEVGQRVLLTQAAPRVRRVFDAQDHEKAWDSLNADSKRELITTLLALGGYVGWTVAPADLGRARRFDASRLSLRSGSD
ncbi:MAG: recombinase family protein [Nocardioides sp.]